MNYYFSNENNQTAGPYTAEQMREFHRQGILREDSWVIEESAAEWKSYASLFSPVTDDSKAGVNFKKKSAYGLSRKTLLILGALCLVVCMALVTFPIHLCQRDKAGTAQRAEANARQTATDAQEFITEPLNFNNFSYNIYCR